MIYNEDCLVTMKRFDDKSISMVVTSPPYGNSRNVKTELSRQQHTARYDVYTEFKTQEEYRDFTLSLFNEFSRILKPNGTVIYNINYGSDAQHSASELILNMASIVSNTEFTIADIIVWKKKSALPNNVSPNRLTRIFEFVFVLCRKSELKTYIANKAVLSISKKNQKIYDNIFNYIEAPNNDGANPLNKATYSSELIYKLMSIYGGEDSGIVYDPFMGTGTTAIGVMKFNKEYNKHYECYGSELSEQQCEFANNRINEWKN